MSEHDSLQQQIHLWAKRKGFWDQRTDVLVFLEATKIGLIMTEAAECMEAHRRGNIFGKDGVIEELADTVIRCLDIAEYFGANLMSKVVEKHQLNTNRVYKHGKRY